MGQAKKFRERLKFTPNTIRSQLVVGSVVIITLLAITAIALLMQLTRMLDAVNALQVVQTQTLIALEVSEDSTLITSAVNRLAPLQDNGFLQQEVGEYYNELRDNYNALDVLSKSVSSNNRLHPYINRMLVRADKVIASTGAILEYGDADNWAEIRAAGELLINEQDDLIKDTGAMMAVATDIQNETIQLARQTRRQVVAFISIALLLSVITAGITTQRLLSSVAHPISELTTVATEVAAGNLQQRVSVRASNEVSQLAQAFNTMTHRLRDLINTLEYRIQERTRALEVSMEISSQITRMQERDNLLRYVVDRIHHGYQLYHTQIFLLDPETDDLVLVMGYGDVGRRMQRDNYRQEHGTGIAGTVASTNKPFLSNNVSDLLNFVPHPLLPHTRAELAVPLRVGNEVVGVLDVQSARENRFKPEDMTLMQALADQTAVALQNIRLLEEMKETLQQVERLNRQLTQSAWVDFGNEVTTSGFRFHRGRRTTVAPDSDAWLPLMALAANRKALVKQRTVSNGKYQRDEMAVPLKLRGEIIGYLGITRDKSTGWTDEEADAVEAVANQVSMALENARLSREQAKTIIRLRDVDRLKSNFLASMSHELRTPLNSIIGFADILLQGIDGELSENAITDITAIHNSGKHLLALINDILDMSKIEAGRMELVQNAVNVPELFTEVSASVSSLLTDKPVELVQAVAPGVPDIWADPLRISQVVINLVSNAIKFTEEGQVTLGAERYGPKLVHLYVQDTGIGIPEDKFGLVFEHFRQVDARNNRKYQGTGMGLAIAKQLVELHGGEMWLESEVGQGSTFHFTIPLAADESSETPALSEPETSSTEQTSS